jgi:hypothetical protein
MNVATAARSPGEGSGACAFPAPTARLTPRERRCRVEQMAALRRWAVVFTRTRNGLAIKGGTRNMLD